MADRFSREIHRYYAPGVTEVQPQYQISSIFAVSVGLKSMRMETLTIRTTQKTLKRSATALDRKKNISLRRLAPATETVMMMAVLQMRQMLRP